MAGNARDVDLTIVGHDRTGAATNSAGNNLDKLKRKAKEVSDEIDRMGNKGFADRIGADFRRAAANIRASGVIGIVVLIGLAIAALPAIATVAGIGIVAGLAGGLAALGMVFAAKNKEVRDAFTKTKDHVVKKLTEMSAVFQPTMINIAGYMKGAFDSFAPELETAFKDLSPVVDKFAKDFFASLDELEPAIKPLTDALKVITDEVGPLLPGIMRNLADGITKVSNAIKDNPEAIRAVVDGLSRIIPFILRCIAGLIRFLGWWLRLLETARNVAGKIREFLLMIALAWSQLVVKVIELVGKMATTVIRLITDMVTGILDLFGKLPGPLGKPFRDAAQTARQKGREIENSTRDAFRGAADGARDGGRKIQNELNKINTRKARADIKSAENRLRELGKMKPSPKVRAEIGALRARIAEAKRLLNSLPKSKTVTITTRRVTNTLGGFVPDNPSLLSAAGPSFALTAPSSGNYRAGGPLTVESPSVTTYVQLDGQEIAAAVRTVISKATGRQSFRARIGRR